MNETNSEKIVELVIPNETEVIRLDKYIGQRDDLKISRSRLQKLIADNLVLVNGRPAGHNHRLFGGEEVVIQIPPQPRMEVEPEASDLDIVFEDEHLLVVNKPAGMVTHPATGNRGGTLVNALLYHSDSLSELQGFDRPGIVHRLDKNTSGLIIIAKNDDVHLKLQTAMMDHLIKKHYYALVCGHMKKDHDTIELTIGRSRKDRKKMAVTRRGGRMAKTEYWLRDRFKLHDLLEVSLLTGRTHQIRVHFSFLGHPVLGDPDYGGRGKWHQGVISIDKRIVKAVLELMPRQALHAKKLEFKHPIDGSDISLEAPLPEDFANLLEFLENEGR